MKKTALLIVDVQNALVEAKPYDCDKFISNLQELIAFADKEGIETIFVRHNGDESDDLVPQTFGWEVYTEIAPSGGATHFNKNYNSAFKGTGLHQYLREKAVESIILCGMQTEYCIDATCKAAFELGYNITIPSGCTTTYNNTYFSAEALVQYFERAIWDNRFASVVEPEALFKG